MAADLNDVLDEVKGGKLKPLYVLWGEELLVRRGAEELVPLLLPDASPGLNFLTLDGASAREVAQELATLPLFPGRKVVWLRDPEFAAPKKGRVDALGRVREAWKAGRRKEAAKRLLALVARAGWAAADLSADRFPPAQDWKAELGVELADADQAFVQEVAAFAREEGLTSPDGDEGPLLALLDRGLPDGHVLVISATELDPKGGLVKHAKDAGTLIERKVAAKLKDLDLTELAQQTLRPFGKRLSPAAESALKERCGGNMRLLESELEKLATYVEGAVIEPADVVLLVARTREEEFLELSDALQKRDLAAAQQYLADAAGQGAAPLALLGAMTSIIRTLLMNHERMVHLSGGRPPRSYDDFQSRVFPKIEAEAKASKSKVPHPYAAFMGMQAATRYRRDELLRALTACAEADLALKLGGGELVLERLVWTVCGRAEPWDSGLAAVRRELERT